MKAFIKKHLRYPAEAKANGDKGTVRLKLKLDKNGKITHVKVVKSVTDLLDKEAIRVAKLMPDWLPAMVGNTAVADSHVIDITF